MSCSRLISSRWVMFGSLSWFYQGSSVDRSAERDTWVLTPWMDENGTLTAFRGATISSMRKAEFCRKVSGARTRSARRCITLYTQTLTLSGDLIAVEHSVSQRAVSKNPRVRWADSHVVGFLVSQHDLHELRTVSILLWPPGIPRILAIVQVREHRDLEGAIRTERHSRLGWVRIQVSCKCSF